MQAETVILRGGRVVCPATGTDEVMDVVVRDGRIVSLGDTENEGRVLDCSGCIVAPGFTDLGAELCDPGYLWREELSTGSEAGAAGGYTTIVTSPKTDPVVDTPVAVAELVVRAGAVSGARILISGAMTKGLDGEHMAELGLMVEAGAVALSDGRKSMMHTGLLRRALDYARPFGAPVMMRPGDTALEGSGVMHEGEVSLQIGLRGIPAAAEEIGVARLVSLAHLTGCRVHLSQVTTAGSVAQIRSAKSKGILITAAVPARHLVLTDRAVDVSVYDTATRLLPPLRSESDRLECIAGVKDGTLDCITADHIPHTRIEKELEYMHAKPGAMGLETALRASLQGLGGDVMATVQAMAVGPASVLGRKAAVEVGEVADLVVFAPHADTEVKGPFRSKGLNEPLSGRRLPGRVQLTMRDGCIIYGPKHD
jgi:dihydroorotase